MGRYYYSKKDEADGCKKIQTWFLKKHRYFNGGYVSGTIKWTNGWTGNESSVGVATNIFGEENYLKIWYTQTNSDGEKQDFDYKIPLTTTTCYFGGKRYWFICPWYANGKYCGRRVGVLYLGGKYFACRHCYDLSYESRNENRRFRDYPLFFVLTGMKKIEGLEQNIKRRYYRGRPTRKQRILEQLRWKMLPYMESIIKEKDIDKY
jgi:hypothetical protein